MTTGLVNASLLHARELFREAIQWGATSLYVAHNHPSGDATPSKEDMEITITFNVPEGFWPTTIAIHLGERI